MGPFSKNLDMREIPDVLDGDSFDRSKAKESSPPEESNSIMSGRVSFETDALVAFLIEKKDGNKFLFPLSLAFIWFENYLSEVLVVLEIVDAIFYFHQEKGKNKSS